MIYEIIFYEKYLSNYSKIGILGIDFLKCLKKTYLQVNVNLKIKKKKKKDSFH